MDSRAKKAIARNRVRILGLDYFDLTGPLLASDILAVKKHKDIKTEATTNKARIDLLLEWIDETAPADAFPCFLQGIRNCQENMLAKKIKKEATDGGMELPPKKVKTPKPKVGVVAPSSLPGMMGLMMGSFDKAKKAKAGTPKAAKKERFDMKPEVSGLGTLTLPFNGLGGNLLPTPGILLPTPSSSMGIGLKPGLTTGTPTPSRKRKSGADKPAGAKAPKTPKTPKSPGAGLNGPPKVSEDTKVVGKSGPTPKIEPGKKANAPSKVKLPKAPRVTRKSSTDKGEGDKKKGGAKGKAPAAAAGSAPQKGGAGAKAKLMTFKDVESKQKDSRQKFRFKSNDATVKVVHFKDKTDISYLGCPYEDNGKVCEKKVEMKNKEFVCESRHRNALCKHIPRLYVTCGDGSADLQLILLKRNVEIFCGKNASELQTLAINDIKEVLDTTVGKKYAIEVQSEKAKKVSKKTGTLKWNNLATILTGGEDGATPAKKKRKN